MHTSDRGGALRFVVWAGVVMAYLLWTVLALFSLLEFMGAHSGLSYPDWIALVWTCAGSSLLFAITSCLLPALGGVSDSCCGSLRHEGWLTSYKQPLRLHWLVHTCCTVVVALLVTQFYTHYTPEELVWLTDARRRPSQRSNALDVVVIMHWREIHLLIVAVWLVLLSLALVLRLDRFFTGHSSGSAAYDSSATSPVASTAAVTHAYTRVPTAGDESGSIQMQ